MLSINKYIEESAVGAVLSPAMKQALIWGGASALGSKLSEDKPNKKNLKEESPAEKRARRLKELKKVLIAAGTGAGAGYLGSKLA